MKGTLRFALLAVLGLGCAERKAEEAAPAAAGAAPPPITRSEAERGRKACQAYVDQVCECALKFKDLTGECELAQTRPNALAMNLRASTAEGNADEKDRRAIQANARRIVEACVEDLAALVKRGCPASRSPGESAGTVAPAPEPVPAQDPSR